MHCGTDARDKDSKETLLKRDGDKWWSKLRAKRNILDLAGDLRPTNWDEVGIVMQVRNGRDPRNALVWRQSGCTHCKRRHSSAALMDRE